MKAPLAVAIVACMVAVGIVAVKSYASNTFEIKETYGSYSVSAPSLADTAPVTEGNGRYINEVKLPNGHYKLKFYADTSKCVAVSNFQVLVKDCGDTNDQWQKKIVNNHIKWYNVGFGGYLSGHDIAGDQFFMGGDGCNGCYQAFNNVVE